MLIDPLRAHDLLGRLLEVPPEHRGVWLTREIADDPQLRERLLAALPPPSGVAVERREPQVTFTVSQAPPVDPLLGVPLGPFRVDERLAEQGGMGTVYRGTRADGLFEQEVAIKVLARGLETATFLHRFTIERRVLGRLQHPYIVGILDGGATPDDRPYLVMEWVVGDPLDQYCVTHGLDLRQRLALFEQVCAAVQYAHSQGVVHSDLKPSNILVTEDAHPKLLDFGLAKFVGGSPDNDLTRASTGNDGLTPAYASPEQIRGDTVSETTDVYALGVVLYELLTGVRPHEVNGKSATEVERLICDENPQPPSDRTPTSEPRSDAALRPIPRGELRGALDSIVLKALDKAPSRRYQTVAALRNDIQRYLDGAPVVTVQRRRTRRIRGALFLSTVAVLAAATAWWTVPYTKRAAPGSHPTSVDASRRVIAVLPFESVTPDGRPGYFAAGITDDVASQLSKVSALRVVSRAAVAGVKTPKKAFGALAQELGVGSVVTGTVREDRRHVRVTVELADARSARVLWSDRYDREITDVFAVQGEIAQRVAEALDTSLTLEEQAQLGKRPTSSVAAYQLFIRGRAAYFEEKQLQKALDLLHQAVEADPDFALAYAYLSRFSGFAAMRGDPTAPLRGIAAAHRALAIDPQLAPAQHGLGLNLYLSGRIGEALTTLRRSIELDPSFATGLDDLSLVEVVKGRFDESLAHAKQGMQLQRNQSVAYYHVSVPLQLLDDDERTVRFLSDATTRFPASSNLQEIWAFADLRAGRTQLALNRTRHVLEEAPRDFSARVAYAEIATFAGAADAPSATDALPQKDGIDVWVAPYTARQLDAYHKYLAGRITEAGAVFDRIVEGNRRSITEGADHPNLFMQNAAVYAVRGQSSQALDWLERAYAAGWRDGRTMARDPLLASVRHEPRFRQIVSRIEADVAAMRARADFAGL